MPKVNDYDPDYDPDLDDWLERDVVDFDWFMDFARAVDWFWWRVFLPVLLGAGAGYALAWYHYIGRYSGSG